MHHSNGFLLGACLPVHGDLGVDAAATCGDGAATISGDGCCKLRSTRSASMLELVSRSRRDEPELTASSYHDPKTRSF